MFGVFSKVFDKNSNWRSNLTVFTLSGRFLEAAVAQKEMKIISLYCLLVNLTSSSHTKKRGCLDEMLFPDVYSQSWTHAVIIPRLFLLRVGRCTG